MPLDSEHRQGGCFNPPWATTRYRPTAAREAAVRVRLFHRTAPAPTYVAGWTRVAVGARLRGDHTISPNEG
jgi:hypothetical protein